MRRWLILAIVLYLAPPSRAWIFSEKFVEAMLTPIQQVLEVSQDFRDVNSQWPKSAEEITTHAANYKLDYNSQGYCALNVRPAEGDAVDFAISVRTEKPKCCYETQWRLSRAPDGEYSFKDIGDGFLRGKKTCERRPGLPRRPLTPEELDQLRSLFGTEDDD